MRVKFLALLLAGLLAGCGPGVDRESFAAIEPGMTEAEVVGRLGEPDRTRSVTIGGVSGTHHAWDANGHVAAIQFVDGRVVSKQWLPAED